MKRYPVLALALLMGCTMLTGCRRENGKMETIVPTTAVTEMTTLPTTAPTTTPTTMPATEHTTEHATEHATHEAGTETSTGNNADATEADTGTPRARSGANRPAMR